MQQQGGRRSFDLIIVESVMFDCIEASHVSLWQDSESGLRGSYLE